MIWADWLEYFMVSKHFRVALVLSLVTLPLVVIDLLVQGCLYGDERQPTRLPVYGNSYRRVRKE